jgi:4'-phosphopantetheinyl transferase EntD
VGIDLEPNVSLPPELVREVLTPEESAATLNAKQVFSAKEAVFKAHFMLARKMYGFQAMAVSLDTGRARFRETSETAGWPSTYKQDLQFQQWVDDHYILSLCIIRTVAGGDNV